MAEEKSPLNHPPHPLSAPGFPASPNLPAAFPAPSDLPAFPDGSSLSYRRSDSPLPACLAPRFTQTKSRDDVAADCTMPHSFKQSLDDLCCLNLIGSRNATLEAPRSTNRAAQNKIFDDFSCLGLGLEDESDGLFRSAPQSRSVSPPPAFPPPLAVSPPLNPARAAPGSAPGAQVSAFRTVLAAATGGAAKSSSTAFAADQFPQLPRPAFPPSPANAPAVPLPPSRPSSSSSSHPSYPLSRESLLRRPTRIILVRHGQSEGNLDEGIYTRIADSRVSLTPLGFEQAVECGKQIRKLIEFDRRKGGKQGRGGEGGKEGRRNAGGVDSGEGDYSGEEEEDDWGVYFYVSPYLRTLQTLRGIGRAFERRHILGVREEPRLREQDFGNFQVQERMWQSKDMRQRFGRFFYRLPEGESSADVYDRVTGFLDSFPGNCDIRVMEMGDGGEYSLAVNHSEQELLSWGLTPDMIADQHACMTRAVGDRKGRGTSGSPGWLSFFDHLEAPSGPPPAAAAPAVAAGSAAGPAGSAAGLQADSAAGPPVRLLVVPVRLLVRPLVRLLVVPVRLLVRPLVRLLIRPLVRLLVGRMFSMMQLEHQLMGVLGWRGKNWSVREVISQSCRQEQVRQVVATVAVLPPGMQMAEPVIVGLGVGYWWQ
ncbi:unnamed protein product [Closterium sp. Naga37s-1]|nr:unnamed protein product [Closterium sp. Naga37s-1]